MEPTRPTPPRQDDGRMPIGTLLAIFAACAVVGGALAVGYQVKRQNQRLIAFVANMPTFPDKWVGDLKAGRFDEARKVATTAYRAALTDEELKRLQALANRLGDKPMVSGWTITGGSMKFSIPGGFVAGEQTLVFRYSLPPVDPAKPGPAEDFTIKILAEPGGLLIDGVSIVPRPVPTPPVPPVPPAAKSS